MKKHIHITNLVAGLLAASAAGVYAEKVKFSELPAATQTAVKAQAGSAEIEDIDKEIRNGRVVYEVAFKRSGQHTELIVGADGTVLEGGVPKPNIITETKSEGLIASLNAFPAAVQKTIRAQVGLGQVVDVEKDVRKNSTVYGAEFQREGKNQVIHVAEDGTLLRHRVKRAGRVEQIISSREPRKVTMNELPAVVQNTIRSQAGRERIEGIDRVVKDGRIVYQAAYKRNGKHTEIRVAEDGAIIQGQGTSTVTTRGSLFGPTVSELPRAVQNTINAAQFGGAEVANIERQIRNGRTVYGVELDQRGKTREILIAEDGSLVAEQP